MAEYMEGSDGTQNHNDQAETYADRKESAENQTEANLANSPSGESVSPGSSREYVSMENQVNKTQIYSIILLHASNNVYNPKTTLIYDPEAFVSTFVS